MAFDREELLQKLTFVLAMNPSITMTELAETTGISKASLHRIYSTKENLQEVILQRVKEIYVDISQILTKDHENFMEDLKKLISVFYANRAYILFICRDVFTDCIDRKDWEKHDDELSTFFKEGQKQGLLNKNFNVNIIANIFLGIVTWLLCMQAESGDKLSKVELEETILKALLNGIGEESISQK